MRRMLAILACLSGCRQSSTAADCGLAPPGFAPGSTYASRGIEPLVNTIHVDRSGSIRWNEAHLGEPEEDAAGLRTLDLYLATSAEMNPRPAVTLVFDRGASCVRLAAVRAMIDHHFQCRSGGGCFQGPMLH